MKPRGWCTGVVVPAQNEENAIERCLRSILRAHDACDRSRSLWIVLVSDSCSDRTSARARAALGDRGEVIECAVDSPGTARRIGVSAVFEHFGTIDPKHIWIANTDADTHVPLDWLTVHLARADENASAVAGIVKLDRDGLMPEVSALYDQTYRMNADGTHSHVHGANLGVRGDAYLDAGGWSHATVSEDHCLWGRLRHKGWTLSSPVTSVVTTSARLHGRAIGGFADTLRREIAREK